MANGDGVTWKWLGPTLLMALAIIGWFLFRDVRAEIKDLDDQKVDKQVFELIVKKLDQMEKRQVNIESQIQMQHDDLYAHRLHTEGLPLKNKKAPQNDYRENEYQE